MALSGVVEFPIPTANSVPVGIAVDSEWVWFAEFSGRNLGRLDPDTGAIEEFAVGEEMCCGVVTGFDSVWFTAHQAGFIGRFTPNRQQLTTYAVPVVSDTPTDIVAGDRFIWYTEMDGNQNGRLDASTGEITEFDIPTTNSQSFGIAHSQNAVSFA